MKQIPENTLPKPPQHTAQLQQRIKQLETHLASENPQLLGVVTSFRKLDKIAYRLGLLNTDQSYATEVPWWPLISILGTFSAGKSSFINYYLDSELQLTGNQAVDDKFTVITYGRDGTSRTIPGRALDADPRFPFYGISDDIEEVEKGEGSKIDTYMQLKALPSDVLKGKILIDSPGFDADDQRTATLRITDRIVNLSDLVLVFFDARHPEPGAMKDTLRHLVTEAMERADSNKFIYILNQIDSTAREDNPEEVVAAWQRSLAQNGLTAGRFYLIYNPNIELQIEDETVKARFEQKRDADLADIQERMDQVEVERAYRIVGALEHTAKQISENWIPMVSRLRSKWRRFILWGDGTLLSAYAALAIWYTLRSEDSVATIMESLPAPEIIGGIVAATILITHILVRRTSTKMIFSWIHKKMERGEEQQIMLRAMRKNTSFWSPILRKSPSGWSRHTLNRVMNIIGDCDTHTQKLNDRYTMPSGIDKSAADRDPASPENLGAESEETTPQ